MENEERRDFLHSAIVVNPYYSRRSPSGMTHCVLQHSVFLGQESGLTGSYYEFPLHPGLGTAVFSEEINADLEVLAGRRDILGTGSSGRIIFMKYLADVPKDAEKLKQLKDVCATASELDSLAVYIQAARRFGCDFKEDAKKARKASKSCLGWSEDWIRTFEAMRKRINSLAVSA